MLVLSEAGSTPRTTLLFGAGLVGGPIAAALTGRGATTESLPFSWSDAEARAAQWAELRAHVEAAVDPKTDLAVVWAAGRAGFGVDDAGADAELAVFRSVVSELSALAAAQPTKKTSFHFLGSAGGLFEGQRLVDATSAPAPRRPYGRLKLEQERAVAELLDGFDELRIYRLTSVYGHVRPNQRAGLVSALVVNGLRRHVTPIIGDMTTLRDYTFTRDIARFVAARVRGAHPMARETAVLASGRPMSIRQVLRLVESATHCKAYVNYRPFGGNSADITFSPSIAPEGWFPSDIETTVRQICEQVVRTGAWTEPRHAAQ